MIIGTEMAFLHCHCHGFVFNPNELTTEVLSNSVISTNKVKMISIGDEWVSGHEGLLVNALIREGL